MRNDILLSRFLKFTAQVIFYKGMSYAVFTVYKFISIAAAVAKEIAVDVAVEAILYPAQFTAALPRDNVTAQPAVYADRRRGLQVPLAYIVPFERLVRKHAGRADFHEVAAEFVLKDALLVPAEIYMVMGRKDVKVAASCEVPVESEAAIALDASVHLMIYERAEILVSVCALSVAVPAVYMSCHHSHVLKMALAAFIAYGAIMRVIKHKPLDDARAKGPDFRVINRDACAICSRGHT
jgi:hypothetical protein